MSTLTFVLAMPVVAFLGVVGSFSSALNGLVGKRLGTFPATLVFLGIGALWCVPFIVLFERESLATVWAGFSWYLYLPGLINVFLIANLIFVVNRIGALLMVSAMFSGQVILSTALDHVGFLGLPTIPITPMRGIAVVVLIVSIVITVMPENRSKSLTATTAETRGPALVMALVQGATLAVVSALTAVLGRETGPFTSSFFFLAPGAILLLIWLVLSRVPMRVSEMRPSFLFPGSFNVIGIAGGVLLVPIVGLQFTTAARVAASVLTGLYIDNRGLFGLPQQSVSLRRVVGTAGLSLGVLLTMFG